MFCVRTYIFDCLNKINETAKNTRLRKINKIKNVNSSKLRTR